MLRACSRRLSAATVARPGQSKAAYYCEVAWEGLRHIYHGFRLFFINTRLAWTYSRRLRKGVALTRRERMLLESATQDLLRLVPFSFFIIVPFAELLLPVALKMFPGLIPSTFETESQGRNRAFAVSFQTLRARQRMMEHLSTTALLSFDKEQQEVVRRAALGESVNASQIKVVAPNCGPDGPLSVYKIPDGIAVALAQSVGAYRWYHGMFPAKVVAPYLRGQIVQYYRKTRQDDLSISLEGIDDLTPEELVKANQVRGMRWTESPDTLRMQLEWWVALSRDPDVPYNALYWLKPTRFSIRRSLTDLPFDQRCKLLGISYLPENVRASLQTLCETVPAVTQESTVPRDVDEILERIDDISESVKKTDLDLQLQDVREAMGSFLTEAHVKVLLDEIRKENGDEHVVTVTDAIEHIGSKIHLSSHVVSTLFDAFEFNTGSRPISEANLLSIGARCREGSANRPPPQPPVPPISMPPTAAGS